MANFMKLMADANKKNSDVKKELERVETTFIEDNAAAADVNVETETNTKKETKEKEETIINNTINETSNINISYEELVKSFNFPVDGVKKGINISVENDFFVKKTSKQYGMTIQQFISYIFLKAKDRLDGNPEEYEDIFFKARELKTSSKSRYSVLVTKDVAEYMDEGAKRAGVSLSGFQDYIIHQFKEKA